MAAAAQPGRDDEIRPKQTDEGQPACAHQTDPEQTLASPAISPTEATVPSERDATIDSARFPEGYVLDRRFAIQKWLGSGGMGEVYEAVDLSLKGTRIALKVIRPEFAERVTARERLQQEVLLAQSIAHPNVCPVYQFGATWGPRGEIWFYTMKLLQGETLAARLRRVWQLQFEEAVRFASEIAAGLDAAHQAKVIHRDVKPGNIFLEKRSAGERAVVTDFGLAHDLTATVTKSAHVAGTPTYMAPEVMRGEVATARSDIYSFGVVSHEMLFGGRPNTASRKDFAGRQKRQLCAVVERCMHPNPKQRYASAGEAAQALEEAAGPWLTRRKLLVGTAAAVILGGTAWSESDDLYRITHPVPRPRKVAFFSANDSNSLPEEASILSGVLETVSGVLTRAESAERDLLVMGPRLLREQKVKTVKDAVGLLGATLILSGSARRVQEQLELTLKLVESATGRLVRKVRVSCLQGVLYGLPAQAAAAAARLLDVQREHLASQLPTANTTNAAAYTAWERGRDLLNNFNLPSTESAIKELQRAVDLDAHFGVAYATLAEAYARKYSMMKQTASLEMAERNSNKAFEIAPDLPAAHCSRAYIEELRGRYDEAAADLMQALRLDNGDLNAQLTLASLYSRQGKLDLAAGVYQAVISEKPNYWPALNDWAGLCFRRSDYKRAEQLYGQATAAAPEAALPWRNLGAVYIETDQCERAISALKRSIELLPSGEAYANLGTALLWSGRTREAADAYEKAVAINAGRDDLWRNLGDAYQMLGMKTRAAAAWRKAAELTQEALNVNSKDLDALSDLALFRAKLGDKAAAKQLLARANARHETDPSRLFTEAEAYELAGERETALDLLQKCTKIGYSKFEIMHAQELAALRKDVRFRV